MHEICALGGIGVRKVARKKMRSPQDGTRVISVGFHHICDRKGNPFVHSPEFDEAMAYAIPQATMPFEITTDLGDARAIVILQVAPESRV